MSRVLTCTECGDPVELFELPAPFVDPERFRCIRCLDARHVAPQLALVPSDAPVRSETLRYDPAQARIPF